MRFDPAFNSGYLWLSEKIASDPPADFSDVEDKWRQKVFSGADAGIKHFQDPVANPLPQEEPAGNWWDDAGVREEIWKNPEYARAMSDASESWGNWAGKVSKNIVDAGKKHLPNDSPLNNIAKGLGTTPIGTFPKDGLKNRDPETLKWILQNCPEDAKKIREQVFAGINAKKQRVLDWVNDRGEHGGYNALYQKGMNLGRWKADQAWNSYVEPVKKLFSPLTRLIPGYQNADTSGWWENLYGILPFLNPAWWNQQKTSEFWLNDSLFPDYEERVQKYADWIDDHVNTALGVVGATDKYYPTNPLIMTGVQSALGAGGGYLASKLLPYFVDEDDPQNADLINKSKKWWLLGGALGAAPGLANIAMRAKFKPETWSWGDVFLNNDGMKYVPPRKSPNEKKSGAIKEDDLPPANLKYY